MHDAHARRIRGIDLKAERVRAGLTQAELAARLGVSARRVANIEDSYRPSAAATRRVMAALDVAER